MTLMACRKCGTRFAVGLPYCPQCTSTDCMEDGAVPKISRHGGPTNTVEAPDKEVASSPGNSSSASTQKPTSSRKKNAPGSRKPARTTDSPSETGPTESSSVPSTGGGPTEPSSATTSD